MTVSGYLKTVVWKGEFDGDNVTVVMKPLELAESLKFKGMGKDTPMTEFMPLVQEILPKYVISIEGLVDAGNSPVSKEEMLNAMYFNELWTKLFLHLTQHAAPKSPK
jgi:hypothetical protein